MMMYAGDPSPPRNRTGRSAMRKVGVLFRELSDDEGDTATDLLDVSTEPNHEPWREDFNGYLYSQARDQFGNASIVDWWGVRTSFILHTMHSVLMMTRYHSGIQPGTQSGLP